MTADGISSDSHRDDSAQALRDVPALQGLASVEGVEAQLRRVNAELELMYAIEQQIASVAELPAMVSAILGRMRASLGFEWAAALLLDGSGAALFAVQREPGVRTLSVDRQEAHRLLRHARTPIRRIADASGSLGDLLIDKPGLQANETYSVPLSDGTSPIGMLQLVNGLPRAEDEEDILRRLGLCAAQLGRALVQRREREASTRAERITLLGQSVGAILQDIRAPLSALSGYVDSMANETAADVRTEYAARSARALARIESMAEDVLAFARGQRAVSLRPVELPRFVDEVREMLAPEVEQASVELALELEYPGGARFDANKLKRVLLSLARNACQAGANELTLRIAREGEYLVFECADTGHGIPKTIESRLFESFATHGTSDGAGLGLAMAKTIIDAHCGRIHVNHVSTGEGRGTVFRIEIPI